MLVLRILSAVCVIAACSLWPSRALEAAPLTGGALQIHDPEILPAGGPPLQNETGSLRIENSIVTAIGWTSLASPDAFVRLQGALISAGNPVPEDPIVPALSAPALAGLAGGLLGAGFWFGRTAPASRRTFRAKTGRPSA